MNNKKHFAEAGDLFVWVDPVLDGRYLRFCLAPGVIKRKAAIALELLNGTIIIGSRTPVWGAFWTKHE